MGELNQNPYLAGRRMNDDCETTYSQRKSIF